jgi:hypothetical protein
MKARELHVRRMLEATPGQPYGENTENLLDVEANMILRRKCIQKFLLPGEKIFTMTCFPRMGTPGFIEPWYPPTPYSSDGASLSSYIPDEVHSRRIPRLPQQHTVTHGHKIRP